MGTSGRVSLLMHILLQIQYVCESLSHLTIQAFYLQSNLFELVKAFAHSSMLQT